MGTKRKPASKALPRKGRVVPKRSFKGVGWVQRRDEKKELTPKGERLHRQRTTKRPRAQTSITKTRVGRFETIVYTTTGSRYDAFNRAKDYLDKKARGSNQRKVWVQVGIKGGERWFGSKVKDIASTRMYLDTAGTEYSTKFDVTRNTKVTVEVVIHRPIKGK